MKLNIAIKTENGYKKYEVDAYPAFEMYGHRFLAHRGINRKTEGRWSYFRQDWRVSEAETGVVLLVGFDSFMDAVAGSEDFLKMKGEKAFKKALKLAKKELNE